MNKKCFMLWAYSAAIFHFLQGVGALAGSAASISNTALLSYTEERAVCEDRNPQKNAYFGDLHIHTSFSYDARPFGIEMTPGDAYHFAKGGIMTLPPYNDTQKEPTKVRLPQPLDFAAVTDHSEFFGELKLCTDPHSNVYSDSICQMLRDSGGRGASPS